MAFIKQAAFTKKTTDLPDKPSPAYTASQIKTYMQTPADELKTTVNKLVDDLNANNWVDRNKISLGAVGTDQLDPAIFGQPKDDLGIQAKFQDHDEQLAENATLRNNISVDVTDNQFGAKGDFNFTTLAGTDNSEEIQAAIDYVSQKGGGRVLIPSGAFLITKTLKMKNNVIVKGAGDSTEIVNKHASEGAPNHVVNSSAFAFKGSSIDDDYTTYNKASGDYLVSQPRAFTEATLPQRSTTLTATDLTGVSVGSWILLREGALLPHPIKSEYVKVLSISGGTITFDRFTVNKYNPASDGLGAYTQTQLYGRATPSDTSDDSAVDYFNGNTAGFPNVTTWRYAGFTPIAPVENAHLENLTIINTHTTSTNPSTAVISHLSVDCSVNNVKIVDGSIWNLDSLNFRITRLNVFGNNRIGSNFLANGSMYTTVERCMFVNVPVYVEEGSQYATMRDCTIFSKGSASNQPVYSTNSLGCVFDNVKVYGKTAAFYLSNCSGIEIKNCKTRTDGSGVQVVGATMPLGFASAENYFTFEGSKIIDNNFHVSVDLSAIIRLTNVSNIIIDRNTFPEGTALNLSSSTYIGRNYLKGALITSDVQTQYKHFDFIINADGTTTNGLTFYGTTGHYQIPFSTLGITSAYSVVGAQLAWFDSGNYRLSFSSGAGGNTLLVIRITDSAGAFVNPTSKVNVLITVKS